MTSARVQLSRAPGWRLPPGARSVAFPTKWANPHRPTRRGPESNAAAVAAYRADLAAGRLPFTVEDVRAELRGVSLACWCPPGLPCHADVLLELAT